MPTPKFKNLADYVVPLHMNGLAGRMLRLPAPKGKTKEILLIYGHHASLERVFGLAEYLNHYGTVTVPDLPGFGGMQSFYKIGQKPTLDNMADYLAAFIKMRYKRRRVTIVGISFGFVVVTRMLQKYPELTKKVDVLISAAGFVHRQDFTFSRTTYLGLRWGGSLLSRKWPARFVRAFMLHGPIIRFVYSLDKSGKGKLADADDQERQKRLQFETELWKCNDIRTHMDTTVTMLTIDLCNTPINLTVNHLAMDGDRYFDSHIVEQHMRVIYNDFMLTKSRGGAHAPTVIADAKSAAAFIPRRIRQLLAQ